MSYTVRYHKTALKSLRNMPPKTSERIRQKIMEMAQSPHGEHNNATKLQGREGYRLRVGDWRVIYEIRSNELMIMVMDIKPRGGAYKH